MVPAGFSRISPTAASSAAQRRLRDAELRGGAREAPLARDREERDQVVEVLPPH
jgi:hypothetical protein